MQTSSCLPTGYLSGYIDFHRWESAWPPAGLSGWWMLVEYPMNPFGHTRLLRRFLQRKTSLPSCSRGNSTGRGNLPKGEPQHSRTLSCRPRKRGTGLLLSSFRRGLQGSFGLVNYSSSYQMPINNNWSSERDVLESLLFLQQELPVARPVRVVPSHVSVAS